MEEDDTLREKFCHFVCSTKTVQPRFQGFLVAVSFACDDSVLLMSFFGYCTLLPNLFDASWLLRNSVGLEPIRNGEIF